MKNTKPLVLTSSMLAALGAMAMLAPFGTDTYLPALPVMSAEFGVSGGRSQLSIAAFTIGIAIGQLILGSLSDRFGRKLIVVTGGVLMTIGSALASLVTTSEMLVLLCLIMGFSAAGGVAGGRAVVADLTTGEASAKPFAILSMLLSIGPIVGPIAGTILLALGGWRIIFVGLAIFAALSTLSVILFVPETLPTTQRHTGGLGETFRMARKVLANKQFVLHGAILWFGFGLMFTYICSSSFIIQNVLGLSPAVNAASFAINGTSLVLASLFTARYSTGHAIKRLLNVGIIVQVSAVVLLIVIVFAHLYNPWFVLFDLFLIGTAMGFVFGPATAMAMMEVRFASGTASAVLGSFQFLLAAIVTACVGLIPGDSLFQLLVVGGTSELLVLVCLFLGTRGEKHLVQDSPAAPN